MTSPLRNLPVTFSYATRAPRPLASLPSPVSGAAVPKRPQVHTRIEARTADATLTVTLGPRPVV